jgi:hypothetical protein
VRREKEEGRREKGGGRREEMRVFKWYIPSGLVDSLIPNTVQTG